MSLSAAPDSKKISLAVFPFNNISEKNLDMDILAMLHAELSGYGFIEIVPVEVIREKFYEIEPGFLWTEKEDLVKRGGILWKIETKIVEKVNETVSADFSLYGDLTSIGDNWRVDAFLVKDGEPESVKTFKLTGVKYNELPAKLTVMSKSISDLLRGDVVLKEAEEDIRQYKGGMVSYPEVIAKVKKHMSAVPQSLPLRALLLDLYLEDRDRNREDILSEGLKIIDLLKQQENSDTRYLLSLALDPFDTVAGIYEKKQDWSNAIIIREKALGFFPYNSELHREGIGRNYYYIADSYEEKGSREKAMDNYKTAVSYLQSSSDFFKQAMEGIDRLKEKGE
ncbi:MAG: tetratricopeptide repeat protein [Nitrospirae bacterium]|nr:tetratricopeptide repeat protein [Nitrospirota bacterium]